VIPALVASAFIAFASCGGETKTAAGGAAPPPGAGYGSASATTGDDVRVLSRDDCVSLRDHQIDIAVAEAMNNNDPGKRLEIEARVRAENKEKTEAWVKHCSGRTVPAKLLRCWKESTTPKAYVECENVLPSADAAVDG
jgi:hypothetical protein